MNGLKGSVGRTFTERSEGGNVGAFKSELDAAFVEMMGGVEEAVIQLATDALAKVIEKSPTDTGQFRNNWLVSIGAPVETSLEWSKEQKETKSGPNIGKDNLTSIAEYKSSAETGKWPLFVLQNNLPYSLRLEFGWSDQAPLGMVELTLLELAGQWDATTL